MLMAGGAGTWYLCGERGGMMFFLPFLLSKSISA